MTWNSSSRFVPGDLKIKAIDPSYSPALTSDMLEKVPETAASSRSLKNSLRGIMIKVKGAGWRVFDRSVTGEGMRK
jgi:hypothetical protein